MFLARALSNIFSWLWQDICSHQGTIVSIPSATCRICHVCEQCSTCISCETVYDTSVMIQEQQQETLDLSQFRLLTLPFIYRGFQERCAICLVGFITGSRLRGLSCGHYFHHKCIQRQLVNYNNSCPICRVKVGCQE
jgi:hypothetical protein